jgi:hypothetical protein
VAVAEVEAVEDLDLKIHLRHQLRATVQPVR